MADDKPRIRPIMRFLLWVITVASTLVFFGLAWKSLPSLGTFHWDYRILGSMFGAIALLALIALFPAANLWLWLIQRILKREKNNDFKAVFWVSQFAKYIPGNIVHHLGRIELSRQVGLPVAGITAILIIETLAVLIIPLLILIGWWTHIPPSLAHQIPELNGFPARAAGLSLTSIGSLSIIAFLLRKLRMSGQTGPEWVITLARGFLFTIPMFGLMLAALVLLANGGLRLDLPTLRLFEAMLISWVAGFLMPGAPAGIGIREIVFIGLLTGSTSLEHATLLSILSRMTYLAADFMVFVIGIKLWRKRTVNP